MRPRSRFENLDPHRGIPVSLVQEDLERKLVHERRGGYCFEHNLVLTSALEHLGFTVEPMLARFGRLSVTVSTRFAKRSGRSAAVSEAIGAPRRGVTGVGW